MQCREILSMHKSKIMEVRALLETTSAEVPQLLLVKMEAAQRIQNYWLNQKQYHPDQAALTDLLMAIMRLTMDLKHIQH